MNIKRFLVFAYDDYYPAGGWGDFRGAFDTSEEAMIFCKNDIAFHCGYDNHDIVDLYGLQFVDETQNAKVALVDA